MRIGDLQAALREIEDDLDDEASWVAQLANDPGINLRLKKLAYYIRRRIKYKLSKDI